MLMNFDGLGVEGGVLFCLRFYRVRGSPGVIEGRGSKRASRSVAFLSTGAASGAFSTAAAAGAFPSEGVSVSGAFSSTGAASGAFSTGAASGAFST